MFIMIDGIDGSGKSTAINAWKEMLQAQGNAIFDLVEYWKANNRYPSFDELKPYDFIFSGEPTYVGVGKVIREELIRQGTTYPTQAIAQAYGLDRMVLYNKIIIPALNDGKMVIQDRGVSTSLCYQALNNQMEVKDLINIPGNALALKHRPDHLILVTVPPKIALKRLTKRTNKKDNVIFEKLDFQTKAAARFASTEFADIFKTQGTQIYYLPGDQKIDIMKEQAKQLLKELLSI